MHVAVSAYFFNQRLEGKFPGDTGLAPELLHSFPLHYERFMAVDDDDISTGGKGCGDYFTYYR
jgi:hypothetical protein